MKALDNHAGTVREMALETVGLALIAKKRAIWAELTNPCGIHKI